MACLGSEQLTKGGSREGELMGVSIQANGEVLILL